MIAGIFTPIVRAVKIFVAADRYKTIRGSTISAHTRMYSKSSISKISKNCQKWGKSKVAT